MPMIAGVAQPGTIGCTGPPTAAERQPDLHSIPLWGLGSPSQRHGQADPSSHGSIWSHGDLQPPFSLTCATAGTRFEENGVVKAWDEGPKVKLSSGRRA